MDETTITGIVDRLSSLEARFDSCYGTNPKLIGECARRISAIEREQVSMNRSMESIHSSLEELKDLPEKITKMQAEQSAATEERRNKTTLLVAIIAAIATVLAPMAAFFASKISIAQMVSNTR